MHAPCLGRFHAGLRAFADQFAFELGEDREDAEDRRVRNT